MIALWLCAIQVAVAGPPEEDAALRYRSGLQVTAAASVGVLVGVGVVVGGERMPDGWTGDLVTGGGLTILSVSTSMVGAGSLAAATGLRDGDCRVSEVPGYVSVGLGAGLTALDLGWWLVGVAKDPRTVTAYVPSGARAEVGWVGTGVRLGLSGLQAGVDVAARRRCDRSGLSMRPGPRLTAGVLPGGLGVSLTRW